MSFFQELKRRNVFRVGVAYALGGWVLLQAADFVLDVIDAPAWILQVFVLVAAIGLPVVLIFAWVYEMTPEGLKRESQIDRAASVTHQTGVKLDRVIIVFLALAVMGLLADRFLGGNNAQSAAATQNPAAAAVQPVAGHSPRPDGQRVTLAVLPFLAMSSGPDDGYFADGLTEEILNSLAQLPELLVTSRTSAFHFKGQDLPVSEIASKLGVANVVEGSVRRSGERLRVTAQLIRASDGFHLWSENYDATAEDTISMQEDIAEKIASALNVVLDESKEAAMRRAGLRDPEAFVALQKGLELYSKAHGATNQLALLRQANKQFEIVERRVPDYPAAYQFHSDLYVHLMMNVATGQDLEGATQEEIEAAPGLAAADLQHALQYARTPQERNNGELDLAFLTSQWRDMRTRIERFVQESGCSESTWVENVAIPFGYAPRLIQRMKEFRKCNPMSPIEWMSEARAMLWAGDPNGALALAEEGLEVAPGEWLYLQKVNDLAALGQFETARHEVTIGLSAPDPALPARMMLAAAEGKRDAAEALFREYRATPVASTFWKLSYYAWMGDHENADRLAAAIDQEPFAGPALVTAIAWCNCGAPWNLEATPKFAGLVKEAGFDWPPASPIRFPLKTW